MEDNMHYCIQTPSAVNNICSQIRLKPNEKSQYYPLVQSIILFIVSSMRRLDTNFEKLFLESNFCGSYPDDLKISAPDEFDVQILLYLLKSQVTNDQNRPGFVNINISNYKDDRELYKFLRKHSNGNDLLDILKIQSWYESMFAKIGLHGHEIDFNGKTFQLTLRKKCGPAHKYWVEGDGKYFSIDLVPGFAFDKNNWLSERNDEKVDNTMKKWTAIPKFFLNESTTAFMACYSDCEREFMKRQNQLKDVIRLTKKIRDRHHIDNLKSYFIKIACLWENDLNPKRFNRSQPYESLRHVLRSLQKHLKKRYLPDYWHTGFNMFRKYNKNQCLDMSNKLKNIRKQLKRTYNTSKLYDIFLTNEEQIKYHLPSKRNLLNYHAKVKMETE